MSDVFIECDGMRFDPLKIRQLVPMLACYIDLHERRRLNNSDPSPSDDHELDRLRKVLDAVLVDTHCVDVGDNYTDVAARLPIDSDYVDSLRLGTYP